MNILPTVKLENMSYFEVTVPTTNGYIFTNARSNDVVIHTQNSNQRYLMGTTSNGVAEFQIDKGLITLNGNVTGSNVSFNATSFTCSGDTTLAGNLYFNNTIGMSRLRVNSYTSNAPINLISNVIGLSNETNGMNLNTGCNYMRFLGSNGEWGRFSNCNLYVASNISCSNLLTASNINFTGQLQQNGVAYVGSQWTGTVGGPLYYGGTVNASNLTTPNVLLANGGIQIAGFGFVDTNRDISCGNINFTGQLQQNGVAYVGSQWTGTVGGPLYYGGTVNASNLTTPNVLLANGGIQIAGFPFVDTNRSISCGNINANLGTLSCGTIMTNNYPVNTGTGAVTCGTIIHSTYYECWVKIMQTSSATPQCQVNFELTPSLVCVPSLTYITRKYAWTNSSYGDSWIPPVAGIWSISVTLNVQGTYAIMGIVKNPAFANSTDYTGASVNNVLSLTDMQTGEVMSNSVTTYLSTSDYIGIGIYGCTTFTAASWRCISTLHATLIQRTS